MIRSVCAVFDSAIQAYGQPFFVPARGAALRSFTDEVNRSAQDNQLFLHPEDFVLYELATFDDEKGTFLNGLEVICRGKDVVKQQEGA